MRKNFFTAGAAAVAALMALTTGPIGQSLAQASNPIVYNANTSDPAPRKYDNEIVDLWNKANPTMPVQHTIVEHEAFKTAIRTYLISDPAPDVLTWFGGERARYFVNKGLIADVSDVWASAGFDKAFAPAFTALGTTNGKQYFMSTNYYWWALYFRPSVLKANNITPPKTFDDLLGACDTLVKAGITPITIGTKAPWTAAAWFDYLDMRINGPEFHVQVVSLQIPYTDPRIKKVMTTWKSLFDHKCFNTDSPGLQWQDAVTPLAQGKAAMYLMGQFITDTYNGLPATTPGYDQKDLDFVRFPIVDPTQKIGEDAPTDGYFLAAKGGNLDGAKKFLAFLGSKEIIQKGVDELGRLPVRTDVDTSKFTTAQLQGIKLIQTADYVAQFYDRDNPPDMADAGLNAFGGFYADYGATDIDKMLASLEDARQQSLAAATAAAGQ